MLCSWLDVGPGNGYQIVPVAFGHDNLDDHWGAVITIGADDEAVRLALRHHCERAENTHE